tara:strand:- start:1005 stop:1799 length:795 start_codon:yes stop_codon:yes gene_type:complete
MTNAKTDLANFFYKHSEEKYQSGDIKGAINDLNQAIKNNPKEAKYYESRIAIFKEQAWENDDSYNRHMGEFFWKLALKDCDILIDLTQKNKLSQDNYFRRGDIKKRLKDYQGAIDDYEKSIEIHSKYEYEDKPTNLRPFNEYATTMYLECAYLKRQLQDYKAAIKYYDKSIELGESHISYIARGMTKLIINDIQPAYTDFKNAIKLNEEGSLEQLKEYQDYYQKKLDYPTKKMDSSINESEDLIDIEVFNYLKEYLSNISTENN